MNGFALGGAAEGFNQFRQTDIQQQNANNALQLGLGRLKIEQQAQANAQQRFDQQRHDEIANQALKDLLGAVQTLRQQNVPEADIQKKFGPALQMLRDNARLRGLDPTTSVDIPFNSTLSSSVPINYYMDAINKATSDYPNVSQQELVAGIKQESGFNRNAFNAKSGASGIAQFTPATAKDRGVNPWNPDSAIPGMASYVSELKNKFGNDGLAWAAYNWGPRNVQKWLQNGADPKQVPKETQQYVQNITGKPLEAFVGQGGTQLLEQGNQVPQAAPQGGPAGNPMALLAIASDPRAPDAVKQTALKRYQEMTDPLQKAKVEEAAMHTQSMREQTAEREAVKQKPDLATADPVMKFQAEALLNGNTQVLAGMGFSQTAGSYKIQVYRLAAQMALEKGVSPEQFNANVAQFMGTKAGATVVGRLQAMTISASTKAAMTAPRVTEISDKINRTEYPTINSVILAAEKGTGNQDVVRLAAAINTFVNNYALAMGNGRSYATDSARKEGFALLNQAWSKGQISAAVDQMLNKELPSEVLGAGMSMKNFLNPAGTFEAAEKSISGGGPSTAQPQSKSGAGKPPPAGFILTSP